MEKKTNGKAVAALVLGILATVSMFLGWLAIVGLVFGIVGIILAVSAKKEMTEDESGKGLATAGLVLSIIGTALAGVGILCFACSMAVLGAAVDAAAETIG